MLAGLRALLAGVIDYAGLFPPASLPLEEAFANYARYRQSPESWMLARFVCPAARLAELQPLAADLGHATPSVPLAVLGRGGKTAHDFLTGLTEDLNQMLGFHHHARDRTTLDALELRLPAEFLHPGREEDLHALLPGPYALLLQAGINLDTFFEIDPGPDWRAGTATVLRALAGASGSPGFKLRCGGTTAAGFPPPEDVALAITACRDAGVPLKFTGGLHHPIRHFDAGVQATMHGFLNVFAAAVLVHARGLDQEQLLPILLDEEPASFRFGEDGFRWRDRHATVAEIEASRRQVVSFGSCSFGEPVHDLRGLGLL
jgi:hypothetical protein